MMHMLFFFFDVVDATEKSLFMFEYKCLYNLVNAPQKENKENSKTHI